MSGRSADVVVIGGGVIGLSIGFRLAERRVGRQGAGLLPLGHALDHHVGAGSAARPEQDPKPGKAGRIRSRRGPGELTPKGYLPTAPVDVWLAW